MNWKTNDVYRWSYNEEMLKRKSHGNNGGTTYWCVACIAIVKPDGRLMDLYWGSDSSNEHFSPTFAEHNLELEFLGNLDDFRKGNEWERACYKDEDCLNLNHPNSSSGNFYIRKDAKQCTEKKRKVIQRSKRMLERQIESQLRQIECYRGILEDKSYEDMQSIPVENDVSLFDESWEENV